MTYDQLVESLHLIDGGPVAGPVALSRRRRFLPVAADVNGDVAVTVFLRRAHGGAEWEEHVLARTGTRWSLLGGGGGGGEELDVLLRPAPLREGHFVESNSGGGCRAGRRWVAYALINVVPAVDRVLVEDDRQIRPPSHGRLAIVWTGNRPISITALDQHGQALETLRVDS